MRQSVYRLFKSNSGGGSASPNMAELPIVAKGKIGAINLHAVGIGGAASDTRVQLAVVKNTGGDSLETNNPQREIVVGAHAFYAPTSASFTANQFLGGLGIDVAVGDRLILANQFEGGTTLLGNEAAADIYVSDFGNVSIVPSRFQRERDAFVVDGEYASIDYLRPMQTMDMAKTGDAEKKLLLCEWALRVHTEVAHGGAFDLTTS